jgi:hypothetical protein
MLNCHCRDCQIASGSAYSPSLIMARSAEKLTKGQTAHFERVAEAATSRHASSVPPAAHPCLLQARRLGNTLESAPPVWDDPSWFRAGSRLLGGQCSAVGTLSIQRYLNSRRTEVARSWHWRGTECPRTTWSVSGVIFGFVSLAHVARALTATPIAIGSSVIPMWTSWVGSSRCCGPMCLGISVAMTQLLRFPSFRQARPSDRGLDARASG